MKRVIITGGPGFGKTSVICALEKKGYQIIQEFSRQVLDREAGNNGNKLPWLDHDGFHRLLFEGRLQQWKDAATLNGIVFFDRGLPDSVAYLIKDGLIPSAEDIAIVKAHPYFEKVFITPPWKEIYQTDKERWEDFDHAVKIHEALVSYYTSLGYEVILLPNVSIAERADFVISEL